MPAGLARNPRSASCARRVTAHRRSACTEAATTVSTTNQTLLVSEPAPGSVRVMVTLAASAVFQWSTLAIVSLFSYSGSPMMTTAASQPHTRATEAHRE